MNAQNEEDIDIDMAGNAANNNEEEANNEDNNVVRDNKYAICNFYIICFSDSQLIMCFY